MSQDNPINTLVNELNAMRRKIDGVEASFMNRKQSVAFLEAVESSIGKMEATAASVERRLERKIDAQAAQAQRNAVEAAQSAITELLSKHHAGDPSNGQGVLAGRRRGP